MREGALRNEGLGVIRGGIGKDNCWDTITAVWVYCSWTALKHENRNMTEARGGGI